MGGINTIALTGATGYLGSKLADAFVKNGYDVVILKRKSSNIKRIKELSEQIKMYDYESKGYSKAFEENKIDCVVHTATSYGRRGESMADIYNVNVLLPVALLDLCTTHKVKYFINTDTSLPATLNTYALSKSQFAQLLLLCQNSIQSINIKLEYFYGPGDDDTKFISFLLKNFLSEAPEIDLSDCKQQRDFVYIDDVVAAYLLLIKRFPALTGNLEVPLGSGIAYQLSDIVEKTKAAVTSKTRLNFGKLSMRSGEVMHSVADTQFLKSLGWNPAFTIDEGIEKTVHIEKSLRA